MSKEQFASLANRYDQKYVYSHLGFNLKITDTQSALAEEHYNLTAKKLEEFFGMDF